MIQVRKIFFAITDPLVVIVSAIATAFVAVLAQVKSAKLLLTEVIGAAGTLLGLGALTKWEYAAIVGGIAVIFAIERQPASTDKALAARAAKLRTALQSAQANGKLDVLVEDVLKTL